MRSTLLSCRRFFGVAEDETVEITRFDRNGYLSVAYARDVDTQLRLMEESDKNPNVTGVYTLFNKIHEGLHARYGEGKFVSGKISRASDKDVTRIRAAYLDFDSERPRDISATDDEKSLVRAAVAECESYLVTMLGSSRPIGVGDSGNGYALFIALEPVEPSKDTTAQISRFLKAISTEFSRAGVKVDLAVSNPARLCPAFGTLKRKGVNCSERPHRTTSFTCEVQVDRISIEAL